MRRDVFLKRFVMPIILGAVIFMAFDGSTADASESDVEKYELERYGYDYKELQSFIGEVGYPEISIKAPYDVSRNSFGTALRFYSRARKKIVVVGCDASVKEIVMPGQAAWLNDNNEIIAWYESGKVHYNNGLVEDGVFISHGGADPSGKYFVKKVRSSLLEIFSISDPHHALGNAKITNPNIFVYDNEVFLFGNADKNTIKVQIFKISNQGLAKKEDFVIRRPKSSPAPFTVQDYNDKRGEILIVDVWDWPVKSKWYTYSMEDRKLQKIGDADSVGFYLQCDIVDSVRKKLHEESRNPEDVFR